jgi:hypothetical protein
MSWLISITLPAKKLRHRRLPEITQPSPEGQRHAAAQRPDLPSPVSQSANRMQIPPDAGNMPARDRAGKKAYVARSKRIMAEPIEPEHEHDPETESPQSESGETDPEMDAEDALPEDPDIRTGFSAEQRRFLWTITGLNVVAVLLGAAIIVAYLASARSQDAAVVKLSDESQTATDEFHRA